MSCLSLPGAAPRAFRRPVDPIKELRAFFEVPSAPVPAVRRRCGCAYCNRPRHVVETDFVDGSRRPAQVAPGARKPDDPSRYRESREAIWLTGVTGPGVYLPDRPKKSYERPSRADFEPEPDPARVERPLSDAEHDATMAYLKARCAQQSKARPALMAFIGEEDWIQGVWLELVNPPADVEQPEDPLERVDRAQWRFEQEQRKQRGRFPCPKRSLPG